MQAEVGGGGEAGRGNDGRGSAKGSRGSTTVFQYSLTGMDVVLCKAGKRRLDIGQVRQR